MKASESDLPYISDWAMSCLGSALGRYFLALSRIDRHQISDDERTGSQLWEAPVWIVSAPSSPPCSVPQQAGHYTMGSPALWLLEDKSGYFFSLGVGGDVGSSAESHWFCLMALSC